MSRDQSGWHYSSVTECLFTMYGSLNSSPFSTEERNDVGKEEKRKGAREKKTRGKAKRKSIVQ